MALRGYVPLGEKWEKREKFTYIFFIYIMITMCRYIRLGGTDVCQAVPVPQRRQTPAQKDTRASSPVQLHDRAGIRRRGQAVRPGCSLSLTSSSP